MTTELTTLLQQAMQQHESVYSTSDPDWEGQPMYFLYKGGELQNMVMLADGVPQNSTEKSLLVQKIRSIADRDDCDAFVQSSEAWTIPRGTENLSPAGERFEKRPDRIEVLSLTAGLRSGGAACVQAYIIRNPDQPPKLDWKDIMVDGENGCKLQSRLDIFNPQTPVRPPANFHTTPQ